MSTDLVKSTAYSRASLPERRDYVTALAAGSNLLPSNYRQPGQIMVIAEAGDMLGIHPMAALVGVYIVEGKPSISANLMNGLVRRAGHKLRISVTGEGNSLSARAVLIRADDPDFEFVVVWDKARAEKAGLWDKRGPWQNYPAAMLKSRAISEVIREGAGDVLMGGSVYTPEELDVEVGEDGEPIDLTQVTPPPAPRAEAPIVDERPEVPEEILTAWIERVSAVETSEGARDLFKEARTSGALDMPIPREAGEPVSLGSLIVEVGKALAETEAAAGGPIADGEPAALDDNVVDAEVVDEVAEEQAREAGR